MRVIIRSEEFDAFYSSLDAKVQQKVDYALYILSELKVIHAKLAKKLQSSDFYELRISTGNEYRVIMFTIDSENLIEATQILLLNGFMKKSSKDYKKEIDKATRILEKYF
jgi:hypothetical protein